MYKLFTDKTELFECNIKLEGAQLKNSQARIVVESEDIALLFKGKIDSNGKCTIPIKKLKGLLEGNSKGEIKLEVIADDTFFIPWKSEFLVEASKKLTVEVTSQDASMIMEAATPKIEVSGIKEVKQTQITNKQDVAVPIVEHVVKIVKMLIKEDVNLENLTIKKNRVNNIIATYIKTNPIQKTQLPKVIDGIITTLRKQEK